jgi:DNA-binding NtrC family response regulator
LLRAAHPREARAALETAQVDLLLTDYQMPETDGLQLFREARGRQPHLRCILMTGYPAVGLAVRAQKEARVDGMMVKPFDAKQLLGLVHHALKGDAGDFRYEAAR